MMPRVFAHAHFGALDTFIAFFWTLALLSAVKATESSRPVAMMTLAGLLWGLALPDQDPRLVPAAGRAGLGLEPARPEAGGVAALLRPGRPSAWRPTSSAGPGSGTTRSGDSCAYLGTGVERVSIRTSCTSARSTPTATSPGIIPWFYFAATVPVGLLALGPLGFVPGLARSSRGPVRRSCSRARSRLFLADL